MILFALLAPAVVPAQEPLEMWQEPRHQLVFDMGHLRLVAVNIPPGDTSLFHQHRYATVYVLIRDALVASQNEGADWKHPGGRELRPVGALIDRSDYVSNPFVHRVRNEDDHALKLLALVSTVPAGEPQGEEVEAEAGALLNNPWFREHRRSLGPGSRSESLVFENPVVVVQVSPGRSDVVPADGGEDAPIHGVNTVPGAWSWHEEGRPFRLRNLGATDVAFLIVEVKIPGKG